MADRILTPRTSTASSDSANHTIMRAEDGSANYILDPEDSLRAPATILRPLSADSSWLFTNGDRLPPIGEEKWNSLRMENKQRPAMGSRRSSRKKEPASELLTQRGGSWPKDKETILMAPFDYLEAHPGKDIRAQLVAAFNAWLRVPTESLAVISKVVGMLHTASLLVDDVEDYSRLRRGVPVAHSIFGTAQTINSANYVYFLALQELQKLRNPAAIVIYTEELLNLHRGQGMDLFWRDTLTCPTEEEYLEMVANKTGGLFRLAVKLMQAESKSDIDCVPLVDTIGLLFQIIDDYKNLSSAIYTINKGLAEDLEEGKFSFPVIHAIRADPTSLVLINVLKQKPKDPDIKLYAINYMEKTGSFAYTRKVLKELEDRAMRLVQQMEQGEHSFGLGSGVRAILERLRVDESPIRATGVLASQPIFGGLKEG